MSGWNAILQDIKQRHPFLRKLEVCGSEHFSLPLPEALKASFDIAENLRCEDSDYKRLAMIFPLLLDCPEWIAVGCSLAAIKQDFLPNIETLPPFSSGQKLLLDGKHVVEYLNEEELYGTQRLWMKMSAKQKSGQKVSDTKKAFPVDQRLRFQPTETGKRLTPIEKTVFQSDHPLDQLLDISSFGNRSIFKNKVMLVSRLQRVRQFAEKTHIVNPASSEQSISLRDLFQWGGITVEGELQQWGHQQIEAVPVIGVAPDLITLREYLLNHQSSDVLIILDGNLPFANDLQALNEILYEGYPVLALMENRRLSDLQYLEDREFKTWTWSEQDLQQFELTGSIDVSNQQPPFHYFHRTVQNYSIRQIEETICERSGLDMAAEKLQIFSNQCHSDNLEHRSIERKFYYCLLNLSRLLRPFGVEDDVSRDEILKDFLEQIQSDVKKKAIWLEQEAVDTAHEFVDKIRTLIENPNSISDKITELKKILQNKTRKNQSAIVLADASEVSVTKRYWEDIVSRSKQKGIHFVTPSELEFERDYDHLIVCGWLGAERMRKLFDACIAPSITVLMYPFEQEWFCSAVSKWRRQRERQKRAELTVPQKAKTLQTQPENLLVSQKSEEGEQPVASPETDFDIADFELRLHTYRRDLYARPSASGETTTKARFVDFSQDMYACLRPNHKVSVVTDFIDGHADESAGVPVRDVSQLKVGDYVIFREGSDSDLLRAIADRGLAKEGKDGHREIAGLWKQVLRRFVCEHSDGFEEALIELRDEGLKPTEITIRSWLNDEHRIGPRNEQDIEIIARVSGNQELQEQLDYVRRAIKEVRGAHLQAAHFLAQKLIAQVPSLLKQGLVESHMIEIEDIGQAFVVCVEDIDEEEIEVPLTEVNRLFRDEF
ncbi:MAG: DrmE family protein [Gemmatimonadota bacterium]|nr:DrmE family protein [Gemmatimonadota bacterium]